MAERCRNMVECPVILASAAPFSEWPLWAKYNAMYMFFLSFAFGTCAPYPMSADSGARYVTVIYWQAGEELKKLFDDNQPHHCRDASWSN